MGTRQYLQPMQTRMGIRAETLHESTLQGARLETEAMRKYDIVHNSNRIDSIVAHSIEVLDNGCLKVYVENDDHDGLRVVRVYAPGSWTRCTEEETPKS